MWKVWGRTKLRGLKLSFNRLGIHGDDVNTHDNRQDDDDDIEDDDEDEGGDGEDDPLKLFIGQVR
jgi:hypothetical protein